MARASAPCSVPPLLILLVAQSVCFSTRNSSHKATPRSRAASQRCTSLATPPSWPAHVQRAALAPYRRSPACRSRSEQGSNKCANSEVRCNGGVVSLERRVRRTTVSTWMSAQRAFGSQETSRPAPPRRHATTLRHDDWSARECVLAWRASGGWRLARDANWRFGGKAGMFS